MYKKNQTSPLRPVQTEDLRQDKWLQVKMQWSKLIHLNSTQANWQLSPATQLVRSPEASFRPYGTSLVSTTNQLVVMSPVAKKHSAEQPIRTCALWNDPWLAETLIMIWIQSHGVVHKSCVLSDLPELQYAKRLLWNFCPMMTKIKLPTPALTTLHRGLWLKVVVT